MAQRDAAIAAALAAYYTSAETDAAIAAAIAPYYTSAETDAAIAAAQLSNGQTWNGGPTFNLLRGSNVLRCSSPSSLLPPPPSSLLLPSSSLLPPPPSRLPSSALPPPPKALKDGHGTTARAIRHARSPQRVRRRAQGWARHHSESAPTRPIPAEGSPASDPTRPIPVEGSSATARMRTAPQRERSDTPDPCRGFIGHGKDAHGTTARALRHARSL